MRDQGSHPAHTVAIVQARMGSTRLPGKIMLPLAGQPVLWHIYNRLSQALRLSLVVIATTTKPLDDKVWEFCCTHGILCYRGSEDDVLDRYYQAAKAFEADPVVRITSDCPVIDPVVVDEVLENYVSGGYEVYGLGGEFPDGLDCEVFSFRALEDAWRHASFPSEREHVGPYMHKHHDKFRCGSYIKFLGMSHHRWSLDEPRDYRFLSAVYDRLYQPGALFLTQDILALLAREPELLHINDGIIRNEGYLKSLEEDQEHLKKTRETDE